MDGVSNSTTFLSVLLNAPGLMYTSTKQFVSTGYETVAGKVSGVVGSCKNFTGSFIQEDTVLGNAYDTTTDFIENNTSSFRHAGAAIGALAVVNSTINLLQRKTNDPQKEAARIVLGSGLIALSLSCAANDAEESAIVSSALAAGLINAVVRAATAVKPTFLVFQLKPKERNTQPQNVVVIPNQSVNPA